MQDIWPHLTSLKWIHSASAGVEKLLFPELVKSSVIVTNAKVAEQHEHAMQPILIIAWQAFAAMSLFCQRHMHIVWCQSRVQ